MAAALPFISVIGTGLSVIGTLSQASAARDAARYNAAVAEQNARLERERGLAEESRQRALSYKALGALRAAYGASGVSLLDSPYDVLAESAMNAEIDALTLRYGGELRARSYENEAALERASGRNAVTSGLFGAASQALLGYGQYREARERSRQVTLRRGGT